MLMSLCSQISVIALVVTFFVTFFFFVTVTDNSELTENSENKTKVAIHYHFNLGT